MITKLQNLQRLQIEKANLPDNLKDAIWANDTARIVELKHRETLLPNEIFAAETVYLQSEIEELELELISANSDLKNAENQSALSTAETAEKVKALQSQIEALRKESSRDFIAVQNAKRRRESIGLKLNELKENLKKLLKN